MGDVRNDHDTRRLVTLIKSDPGIEENFGERLARLAACGDFATRINSGETEVADFLARLFFQFCSPASLSFTSSSLVRYLYKRSPYLERLFSVEGFHGPSMEPFLGPGAIRLEPDIARRMWGEIIGNLPKDMTGFYPPEVSELNSLDARIDKQTYRNVSIGYL